MKEYILTIHGTLKVMTENFEDIQLNQYSITDLDNLTIEDGHKK